MPRGSGFLAQTWRRMLCAVVTCIAVGNGCFAQGQAAPGKAPFLNIELLLDNSPSMEIGATPGDIAAMMHLTPCSAPGSLRPFGRYRQMFGDMSASGQDYVAYQCKDDGKSGFFGGLRCPIPAARGVDGQTVMTPGLRGPRCAAPLAPLGAPEQFVTAGAPCAFACHWDRHQSLSADRDYYGLARSTIGQPPCYQKGSSPDGCAITLRLDLVKNAVTALLASMQDGNERGTANLSVGVFTFGTELHPVYPLPGKCGQDGQAACQAGRGWPLALGSIGTAPDLPNENDNGIQPLVKGNGAATDFPAALTTLASRYLTKAGTGAAPESPEKALFLITDGMDDHYDGQTRRLGAMDPALCRIYKSMGFDVFVLYTPYYPLMNPFYFYNVRPLAENDGPGSLSYNLRQCASDPVHNFIKADPADATSIARGLQAFLARAIKQ